MSPAIEPFRAESRKGEGRHEIFVVTLFAEYQCQAVVEVCVSGSLMFLALSLVRDSSFGG